MTLWFIARAAGLVALAALTLATALGAFGSIRESDDGVGIHRWRFGLQYVHRAAAVTGLLLILVHITTLVLDPFAGVSLSSVVIPFTATYRPLAVGLGSFALFGFVLTALVGAARGRLAGSVKAARAWRAVHVTAYGAWGVAMLHGLLAGTDALFPPITLAYLAALLVVGVAAASRYWSYQRHKAGTLSRSRRTSLARAREADRWSRIGAAR